MEYGINVKAGKVLDTRSLIDQYHASAHSRVRRSDIIVDLPWSNKSKNVLGPIRANSIIKSLLDIPDQ